MPPLPYRIAVLCYLFDERGRILLLHRRKPPNRDLYSPVGGKLEQDTGESPTACAQREILEETGLDLPLERLHLTGIVSEHGYEGNAHWLLFLYEALGPVHITRTEFDEGLLEWHPTADIEKLPIPETDQKVIWPMFWRFRGRFFAVHIDCKDGQIHWRLEQPVSEEGDVG